MADAKTIDLEALRRLCDDLPYYAETCLKIKDKGGKIIPLVFNRSQLYLHERLEAQKARTGKVRALICKGRQTTISTYVSARYVNRRAKLTSFRRPTLTRVGWLFEGSSVSGFI